MCELLPQLRDAAPPGNGLSPPGERVLALARFGAALASEAPPVTIDKLGRRAILAGANLDDIVGTLVAVAPVIGKARLVKATPLVARVIGYDIDAALEALD